MHDEDILLRSIRGTAYLAIAPCILLSAAVWFTSDSIGIAIAYDTCIKDEKTTNVRVNATDNLGPLSEFILNFSRDLPVFYGLTSVLLAVVLGVAAAMIRRVYSNWDDKRLVKLKK